MFALQFLALLFMTSSTKAAYMLWAENQCLFWSPDRPISPRRPIRLSHFFCCGLYFVFVVLISCPVVSTKPGHLVSAFCKAVISDFPAMGFAVRVRSAGQKYGPTCHQRDRADVTEFVTLVRLSSLGQHIGVFALAG